VAAPLTVVPRGGAHLLRRAGEVREVAEGDELAVGPVRVRAVHAEHDGRRWPGRPGAPALGYVVRGSRAVYFAGDTDAFPGMAALADERLDLALMPVWGWGPRLGPGHLDPRAAAEALALVRPRRAVPIHWGTYATAWARRRPAHALREPAEAFARHAAAVAPEVEVVLLRPGEATALGG
jgi:L-ascorbate metabolism protein UlaG (beta-lactamase superfamily)